MKVKKGYLFKLLIFIIAILVATIVFVFLRKNTKTSTISAELSKMRTYDKVRSGDQLTNSDYVQFDSFFLADLDGDGYVEKVRGTCKEIGGQDTLYMDLNVLTEGYLKDGKITINADNFYFQTAIVKDGQIANNYISSNTSQILLNKINNGTQKLLSGVVKSGDYSKETTKLLAIGNDKSKYSKINSVTLTGTHVIENADGTISETNIDKTINFNVDWYGEVDCTIPAYINGSTKNKYQNKDITDCIDEKNNNLNLKFNIATQENKNQLILKESYIEGTIPQLNGYSPKKVEITGKDVKYTYDEKTRTFTARREAVINDKGIVTTQVDSGQYSKQRYNEYTLNVTYPLESYLQTGTDTLEIKVPVKAYYEGYNNTSSEFTNPYKSNIAEDTIIVTWSKPKGTVSIFEVGVGDFAINPNGRYIVSKQKPLNVYNGASEEKDYYTIRWYGYVGTDGESNGIIMKETKDEITEKISDRFVKSDSSEESMANLSKNVGIYFSNPVNLLGENGWIKVYDDETNKLIQNFTKDNWNKYTSTNPYMYNEAIKHIRVETSNTNKESSLTIYNIKELDDEYITENYTQEEFNNLKYIKSTLVRIYK